MKKQRMMKMNKLPHEILRKIVDDIDDDERSSCSAGAINFMRERLNVDETDSYVKDLQNIIRYIAYEIEKYYTPRPRFQDGELACENDVFVDSLGDEHTISLIEPAFKVWDTDNCFVRYNNLLKRPEPKALDADGVEIKVGDTVWIIESGAKGKVEEINKDRAYVKCDDGWLADVHVSNLTHQEPDSLEKLRDDMREFVDAGYKYPGGTMTNGWLDRLTAIMERDA